MAFKSIVGSSTNIKLKAIMLKTTTNIKGLPVKSEFWGFLEAEYKKKNASSEERLMISVINSAVTQSRAVFCLTREFARDLLKADANWSSKDKGSDNAVWAAFIKLGCENKIFTVSPVVRNKPRIFTIIEQSYLDILTADITAQAVDCQAFVDRAKAEDILEAEQKAEPKVEAKTKPEPKAKAPDKEQPKPKVDPENDRSATTGKSIFDDIEEELLRMTPEQRNLAEQRDRNFTARQAQSEPETTILAAEIINSEGPVNDDLFGPGFF